MASASGRACDATAVLAAPNASSWVPGDSTVRRVTDEQTVRDAITVGNDAFGGADPTESSSGRRVASVDGQPAGTGGSTLTDVCRLRGGSSHSSLRGRGAYRAVLDLPSS